MNLRIPALLLSLAATGLGVALWREQVARAALAAQNARLSRQIAELRYEAKRAARQAEEFNRRAVELDSQLGSAKSRTTATETRHFQLTSELTETKSRLSEREQREVALLTELAALRRQVAEAVPIVASRGEVAAAPLEAQTTTLADDPAVAQRRIVELEQQLTQLLARALAVPAADPAETSMPPAPYQVVRVGPRDAFVVLDYGDSHGARPGQILGLWRGTSEVARVQISDARSRFSLAQVLPPTLKGQLQTGDLVLLTN
jgi:hypothetical protein